MNKNDLIEYVVNDLIDKEIAEIIFNLISDENGNFKNVFYENYDLVFDDTGNTHFYIRHYLYDYIKSHNFPFDCDIVKLYHFMYMDHMTGGNYSTVYAWR